MERLNKFELEILAKFSHKYECLKEHIPFLIIKDREYTGVGLYVNFSYIKDVEKLPIEEASLGINTTINVKGLKEELTFELDISNGKINFIEFITYGDKWDGKFDEYTFSD